MNCGGARAGYLGRRALVCRKEKKKKRGAKPGRREGDLKAQHFFGLDDKNHGVKEEEEEEKEGEKTHLGIMYSCWVCKTQRGKEVSVTSSARDFLTTKSVLSSLPSSFTGFLSPAATEEMIYQQSFTFCSAAQQAEHAETSLYKSTELRWNAAPLPDSYSPSDST